VNSISLKNGERRISAPAQLIRRYGAATIVMAFDEKSQADTFQRKSEICRARLRTVDAKGRVSSEQYHFRSKCSDIATVSTSTAITPSISSKRRAGSKRICQGTRQRRGQQYFVFVSSNNTGARSDAAAFLYQPSLAGLTMAS